jgi:hypothetical protein
MKPASMVVVPLKCALITWEGAVVRRKVERLCKLK